MLHKLSEHILTTNLSILHNYFDSSIKLLFWSISS